MEVKNTHIELVGYANINVARNAIQKIIRGENITLREQESILSEGLSYCYLNRFMLMHNSKLQFFIT